MRDIYMIAAVAVIVCAGLFAQYLMKKSKNEGKQVQESTELALDRILRDGLDIIKAEVRKFVSSSQFDECIRFYTDYSMIFYECIPLISVKIANALKNPQCSLCKMIPDSIKQHMNAEEIIAKMLKNETIMHVIDDIINDAYTTIVHNIADEGDAEENAALMAAQQNGSDEDVVPERLGLTETDEKLVDIGGDIDRVIGDNDLIEFIE